MTFMTLIHIAELQTDRLTLVLVKSLSRLKKGSGKTSVCDDVHRGFADGWKDMQTFAVLESLKIKRKIN